MARIRHPIFLPDPSPARTRSRRRAMTSSAQMADIAFWMMIGGAVVFVLAVASHLMSDPALQRGTLVKPLAFIGLVVALIGAFLSYWLGY
jgi:hypothetical protein